MRSRGVPTALMVAVIVATADCVAAAPVEEADPQGTLTTVIPAIEGTGWVLDPQIANSTVEIGNVMMVFEPPLRFDPQTLRSIPGAAKALPDISADGRTYKLTIRDDSKYSDGTRVRASDFAYAFSRLCDPAIKGPYASIGYVVVGCADWSRLDPKKDPPEKLRAAKEKLTTSGIRATSDTDLTITLVEPAAYFSSVLALWVFAPTRESDVAHGGDAWTEPATYVGNGPFVLSAWKHDQRLTFTPNRYFRDPARLKQWTKLEIVESAVAVNAYRHDEIDVMTYGSTGGGLAGEIERDPVLLKESTRTAGVCTIFVGFNARRPPFDDPTVRLAFAKALDRDAYVRVVLGGLGSPALSLIPPGLPGYDKDDTVQRFDPAEARRLLASSRYAGTDVLRSVVVIHNLQVFSRIRTEWLRDQWRSVLGLDVGTEQMDGASLTQLYGKAETIPQVFFNGWCADYPDQQDWLSLLFHSTSRSGFSFYTGFSDAQFDSWVSGADRDRDQIRRDELYQKASRMLSDRAVLAFLNNTQWLSVRKPWVRGVIDSALDWELGSTAGTERVFVAKRGR